VTQGKTNGYPPNWTASLSSGQYQIKIPSGVHLLNLKCHSAGHTWVHWCSFNPLSHCRQYSRYTQLECDRQIIEIRNSQLGNLPATVLHYSVNGRRQQGRQLKKWMGRTMKRTELSQDVWWQPHHHFENDGSEKRNKAWWLRKKRWMWFGLVECKDAAAWVKWCIMMLSNKMRLRGRPRRLGGIVSTRTLKVLACPVGCSC